MVPPYRVKIYDRGRVSNEHDLVPQPLGAGPLISCLMPTRGDLTPARFAIECFLQQTYPCRELVIVCRTLDSEVKRFVQSLDDSRIRFVEAPDAQTVGDLRNVTVERGRGDYIATWDDDDLYHPDRLMLQFQPLQQFGAGGCVLIRETLWWPARNLLACSRLRPWENSLLAKRSEVPRYLSLPRRSDHHLVRELALKVRLATLNLPHLYVRTYHGQNIWGAPHFENQFRKATVVCENRDYEAALSAFAETVPILEYADALAGREAGAGNRL
jgi:glycosyltransferase involved in cell wall biosynthesis